MNEATAQTFQKGEFYIPTGTANGRAALVLHEAPGITSNVKRRSVILASLGYTVFAPNLHQSNHVMTPDETRSAVSNFYENPPLLRSRVEESLNHLCVISGVPRERVVVIGYCFGGMAALELARSGCCVAAIVSFHGLLSTKAPAQSGEILTPILVCTGGLDEFVPAEDILSFQKEMSGANARWELIIYGSARHSFTNLDASSFGDHRMHHDPNADKKSWSAMLEFLNAVYA